MSYQISIESLFPVTEGLMCHRCGKHAATMTSKYRESKGCFYDHEVICGECGFRQYPTGVKSFILLNW